MRRTGFRIRRRSIAAALAIVGLPAGAIAAVSSNNGHGRIGPEYSLTPYGHHLHPAGRMTRVGDFSTGGALTPDGRFYWAVDAGHGRDDVQIVSVKTGRRIQILPLPGAYVGIAIAANGRRAYVSGEPIGDSKPIGPTVGKQGDVVHVFSVDRRSGHAKELTPISLPTLTGGTAQSHAGQVIPGFSPPGPTSGSALDWPEGLGVSHDGSTVAVALNQADQVALVNTHTRAVRTVKVGSYPYGVAISNNGRTAWVSSEYAGVVSAIDIPSARVTATIGVGGPLGDRNSHPEGVVLSRNGRRLYVAVASRDLIAAIDTRSHKLVDEVSVQRGDYLGSEPVAVAVTPNDRTLFAADAGEDAVAEIALPRHRGAKPWSVLGRIPTAEYPSAVSVTPNGRQLVWLAAEGLGAGPNPDYGTFFANSDAAPYGQYVPDMLLGRVGVLGIPTAARLRSLTKQALAQGVPNNLFPPPPGNPVRPDGPIRHVFIIVKENRTYDQLLGSDSRGDGDSKLELFDDNGVHTPAGGVTPNAHALVRRFPLLDHFYADSEVSVDGHLITSGGYAIDYVKKALHPNYSNRGRVDEFGSYPVSFPPKDFIFDQAVRQGISFRNYGEINAGILPGADDGRPTYAPVEANTRVDYPEFFGCEGVGLPVTGTDNAAVCDSDSGTLGAGGAAGVATSRFDYFQAEFLSLVNSGTVPSLVYLTLPNDHTNGVQTNYPTPRAMVADNDLGLGQIVDLISHSPIWGSSAILVMEDDSQDGADHVDAHRMPAYVISPWANEGAVIHTRYDQESMLRTMELILGMQPLSRFDANAEPMYAAFRDDGHPDLRPYDAIVPQQSLSAITTAADARAAGPLVAELPFDQPDVVPQAIFDRVLWGSVYGWRAKPPPPGPNPSPLEAARAAGVMSVFRAGYNVRAWLLQSTDDVIGDDIAAWATLLKAEHASR
jgi:DNA-binding beta-propeller fold protein YncE